MQKNELHTYMPLFDDKQETEQKETNTEELQKEPWQEELKEQGLPYHEPTYPPAKIHFFASAL